MKAASRAVVMLGLSMVCALSGCATAPTASAPQAVTEPTTSKPTAIAAEAAKPAAAPVANKTVYTCTFVYGSVYCGEQEGC